MPGISTGKLLPTPMLAVAQFERDVVTGGWYSCHAQERSSIQPRTDLTSNMHRYENDTDVAPYSTNFIYWVNPRIW